MPVVKLKRGGDEWLLQVGEEHVGPNTEITNLSIEEKALLVANGDEKQGFLPGNGEPGWEVVEILDDNNFQELYGVTNMQLGIMPPVQEQR